MEGGKDVKDVTTCGNHGCCSNDSGICFSAIGECFGYIEVEKEKEEPKP